MNIFGLVSRVHVVMTLEPSFVTSRVSINPRFSLETLDDAHA